MTINENPSGLPEQEPTSPTAVVLCAGEAWVRTGANWESLREIRAWGGLRDLAAERGGATLFDLADLPTGLTEVQKVAIRSAVEYSSEGDFDPLMSAFHEVFSDDLEIAKWESGKGTDDLIRVASMDGARIVATRDGITHSGMVSFDDVGGKQPSLRIAGDKYYHGDRILLHNTDRTVTVTAPKPVNRTGVDPVVLAGQRGTERSKQLKRVGANIYRDQESWARFSKPTDARDADALRRAFLGR